MKVAPLLPGNDDVDEAPPSHLHHSPSPHQGGPLNLNGRMAESTTTVGQEVSPWGWQAFFEEVDRFVQSSERQYGRYASQRYTEYVLDRLELITEHVTRIRERLLEAEETLQSQEERSALPTLVTLLGDVLQSLSPLVRKWQQHLDALDVHTASSRYQVPVQQLLGPDRPRLLVN